VTIQSFPLEVYPLILTNIPDLFPLRSVNKTFLGIVDSYPHFKVKCLGNLFLREAQKHLASKKMPIGSQIRLSYRLVLGHLKKRKIEKAKALKKRIVELSAVTEQWNAYESVGWKGGGERIRTLACLNAAEELPSDVDHSAYLKILDLLFAGMDGTLSDLLAADGSQLVLKEHLHPEHILCAFMQVGDKKGALCFLRFLYQFFEEQVEMEKVHRLSYPLFSDLAKKLGDEDFAALVEKNYFSLNLSQSVDASNTSNIPQEVKFAVLIDSKEVLFNDFVLAFPKEQREKVLMEMLFRLAQSSRTEEFLELNRRVSPAFGQKRLSRLTLHAKKHQIISDFTHDSRSAIDLQIAEIRNQLISRLKKVPLRIQGEILVSLYSRTY